MKISLLERLPSFALLGPGFNGGETRQNAFTLIRPLETPVHRPRLVYVPYERNGAEAWAFGGDVTFLPDLDLEIDPDPDGTLGGGDGPGLKSLPDSKGDRNPLAIRMDTRNHREAVNEIREAIASGDVYQVNLTLRAYFHSPSGAAVLRRFLRRGIPSYAAWVRLPGGEEFVSASPELFFEIEGERIRCQPMKGTGRPGAAGELDQSTKDQAELDMITDLIRNDLTPICHPRSVRVVCPRRSIELPYAVQTVSDVEGRLLPGHGYMEALAALHPGGSITGAPKPAAMEMIRRLEPTPRGPYCGALGFVDGARAAFSLMIRTAGRRGQDWVYGAGGGIVWDSDPQAELDEVFLKLAALQ